MAKKLWIGYRYAMDKLWIRIHGYIAMYNVYLAEYPTASYGNL